MKETNYKYVTQELIRDKQKASTLVNLEIAYQLKRIADIGLDISTDIIIQDEVEEDIETHQIYMCIYDYHMDDGSKSFSAGNTYKFNTTNVFGAIDDDGEYHKMPDMADFNRYFIKVNYDEQN